ncbi:MAG: hypothetical protein LBQ81_07335, partial [Zoogloeaceae bacterium]|nr:hypothetical protein [Zoogloeaceae bacterium]
RFAALTLVLSVLISYLGQPLIHGNDQAVNVIVMVFSVLAGFLVAIIAVVGDPVLLPPGTWRAAEIERDKLVNRLVRHKWLFVAYLITLALIFFALLVAKALPDWGVWLERLFLFFATFSFLLSLQLPSALMQAQRERIDAVIEHRRQTDGIHNGNAKDGETRL